LVVEQKSASGPVVPATVVASTVSIAVFEVAGQTPEITHLYCLPVIDAVAPVTVYVVVQ
jgi:hypothetical protein